MGDETTPKGESSQVVATLGWSPTGEEASHAERWRCNNRKRLRLDQRVEWITVNHV